MQGIGSQITSSPRVMFALVAAGVAVVVISQLFGGSSAAPDTGAQFTAPSVFNRSDYSSLFDVPRSVPSDPSRNQAEQAAVTVTPGFAAPPDEPVAVAEEIVVEIPVSVPQDPSAATQTIDSPPLSLRPTFSWLNVFGESATLNGKPVQAGDVVTAFDPDGTLAGHFTVAKEGRFGLMAVYEDDPATRVDEGATPGDALSFKINGVPAVALGSQAPVWTTNGALLLLNLAAG